MARVGVTVGAASATDGASAVVGGGVSTGLGGVFTSGVFESGVFQLSGTMVDGALIAGTSVNTRLGQIQPGSNTGVKIQRVGWRIAVDSTEVDDCVINTPAQVSKSVNRPIQIGGFDSFAEDGRSTLGDPLKLGAPITGLKTIDMSLAFRADNGEVFDEVMLTGGMADASERSYTGPVVDSISVADRGMRFADVPVTLQLDAGHATTRDALIIQLATLAGVTDISIQGIGGTVNKPVDIIKGDWLSLAQAIAAVKGHRLLWDEDGTFTNVNMAYELTANRGPLRWSFGLADVVMGVNGSPLGGIRVSPAPEAYTAVAARGSKQVIQGANCAQKTERVTVSTTGPFSFTLLGFQQDGAGTVTSTGAAAPPSTDRTISETVIDTTTECGDETLVVSTTRRLFNPPRARYERTAAGAITSYQSIVFIEANSASEVAFLYDREHFIDTDKVIERTIYDSQGFVDQEIREVWGWYNPRRHVRSRTDLNDPWDTQTADSNWWDHGNGEGYVNPTWQFGLVERQTVTYGVQNGYIRQRVTEIERYDAKPGATYLYGGGDEYGESQESFQTVSHVDERFDFVGNGFRTTVNEYTTGGVFVGSTVTRSSGGPPSAKKRRTGANNADRYEQQEIKADCSAPNLLTVRRAREANGLFLEWAENEGELSQACNRLLISGQTPRVEFQVPANPWIKPGDWGHFSGPGGVEIDFLVTDADTSGPKAGPILTSLAVLVPPGGVSG